MMVGIALSIGLGTSPAAAQFVCAGSADGNAPVDGALATAGAQGVACGPIAQAGLQAVAVGRDARTDTQSVAVGESAYALGTEGVSVGYNAGPANPTNGAVSIGRNANFVNGATGLYSTAIGSAAGISAVASQGNYSIAIGGGDGSGGLAAQSLSTGAIAIGNLSTTATARPASASPGCCSRPRPIRCRRTARSASASTPAWSAPAAASRCSGEVAAHVSRGGGPQC